MIRVRIGDSERELSSVSENWINQNINRRMADGLSVCVRGIIKEDQLNMSLSSAICPQSAGGGRPPNRYEKQLFNLWEKSGLDKESFRGGNLVSFLKQLNV